jgi:autotransporter-associated beta strand protein
MTTDRSAMPTGRLPSLLAVIATLVAADPCAAQAPTSTWTSSATDVWSNGLNWTPTGAPTGGATTVLQFNAGGTDSYTATNDLGTFQLNALLLNSTSSSAITIDGNDLSFVANGTTNPVINQLGTGAVTVNNNFAIPAPSTGPALAIGGTGAGAVTLAGAISGGSASVVGLQLNNTATTVTLTGASSYLGGTVIAGGTLKIGATNTLPTASGVAFGLINGSGSTSNSAANTGAMDLSGFSQTLNALSVVSNSATANTITIGSGQTLAITNASGTGTLVNIAGVTNSTSAATTTKLTLSGAGAFTVNTPQATFGVGQTAPPSGSTLTEGSSSTLSMSGLATFNATVSIFRVGDFTSTTNSGASTAVLATTSTITAGSLTVGVSGRNAAER